MKTYARVHEGIAVEIIQTEQNVAEQFHPDFVSTLVDVTDHDPMPGEWWIFDGEAFHPPEA